MWLNFVKNLRFEWKRTLVKIWRELKLSLIGFFEGTRAIACTRREEKDERKRNNQRYFLFKSKKRNNKRHLFFKSNKEITKNNKNAQTSFVITIVKKITKMPRSTSIPLAGTMVNPRKDLIERTRKVDLR